MSRMRYTRVGSKKQSSSTTSSPTCHGFKGFRLNTRRFSVQRLRTKFLFLVRLFNKCRNSYRNALHSLRKNIARSRSYRKGRCSRRNFVVMKKEIRCNYAYNTGIMNHDCSRLRSFARTNSFYTEAIADCLDFIKRNSLSMDQNPVLNER